MILFCTKHGMTEFSIRKSGKRVCRNCETYRSKSYRIRLKEKAVSYKGGCCNKCGYNKSLRALDFHHRDPSQKDFAIGETRQGKKIVRSWEGLIPELDKCDLLCKNCHAEVHEEIEIKLETMNYNIHKKNIAVINNHLISERKTPEELLIKINSGVYDTQEKLNHRELLHNKWIEEKSNPTS